MSCRDQMVALANAVAGVSVSSDLARYLDTLGPLEAPAMRDYFASPRTSGCGLVVRGLWRELGVDDPSVLPPYHFGTAISALVGVARKRKAWILAAPGKLPKPGDFVLVGGNPQTDGGVEHVFTVVAVPAGGTASGPLASVDGGQVDAHGQQAIAAKFRRWSLRGGALWDVSRTGNDPGAGAPGGRRVQGWADLELIMAAQAKPEAIA